MNATTPNPLPRFQRSEDGEAWTDIEPHALRKKLRGAYKDVDLALKALVDNPEQPIITTGFAVYRLHFSR